MTAFSPEQQHRLLDLQALDTRRDQLQRQRREHPTVATLADLAGRADAVAVSLTAAEQALDEAASRLRTAEREAEDITRRQQKDQTRLDAGAVSSPRELESLQHEIATLQSKLDDVETEELEAMEQLDTTQAEVTRLRDDVGALDQTTEQTQAERDAAWANIDDELADVDSQRGAIAGELPADLVSIYERSRDQHGGVGVGALRHGRCEGCRLSLTPADLARATTAPADALVRCEECGRLLVRVED